jgi:hypothetical protein
MLIFNKISAPLQLYFIQLNPLSYTMVNYTKDSLIITIPTPSPEADHSQLILALVNVLRMAAHCSHSDQRVLTDSAAQITVLDLIGELTPDENQMRKAYN